jgi:hypothetical protein
MANSAPFEFPAIADDDVRWAAVQLGLSESSFFGKQENDPRKTVIQSKTNLDVAACPGSGKTTVLIAKLAILAKKWKHNTRGICVLSHTNVARREIEKHLGNSSEGQRLLSYPHFVGTIHSFVNEFLASPWLRAQGYPIKMIDTEVCESRRWGKLPWKARNYLEQQHIASDEIRVTDADFNIGKKKGNFPCGPSTETYKAVQKTCKDVAADGYHCYDDMFVWAHDMLKRSPGIRDSIQHRFPLLFIDEAQDNSDEQAQLLKGIFIDGGTTLIRQRFGDGNQAIYDFTGAQEATTDAFPNELIKSPIPDSFRFGQAIANLSDPLGLDPYSMVGQGPKLKTLESGQSECSHTIFLFEDDSIGKVMAAYGDLLLDTFSEQEVREGQFTAVGMVHRLQGGEDATKHCPHRVGDYWNSYNPKLTGMDPTPQTFVHYIYAGLAASREASEAYLAIEKIAQGILRLAAIADKPNEYSGRKHKHRFVLESLKDTPPTKTEYLEFLNDFVVMQEDLCKESWNSKWQKSICRIAEKICGTELKGKDVDSFLSWGGESSNPKDAPAPASRNDNVYLYARENRGVAIKVGSIHSVKGQTHTATLVLETAWYECNLAHIVAWLSGEAKGKPTKKNSTRDIIRLKTHYVAMTRPSHLLCLALHKSALCSKDGQIDSNLIGKLKGQKWRLVNVASRSEL